MVICFGFVYKDISGVIDVMRRGELMILCVPSRLIWLDKLQHFLFEALER